MKGKDASILSPDTGCASYEEAEKRLLDALLKLDGLKEEFERAYMELRAEACRQKKIYDSREFESNLIYEDKFPIRFFIPPYFKGSAKNGYPLTAEGISKIENRLHNTLNKPNKPWRKNEVKILNEAVTEETIRYLTKDSLRKKSLLTLKINAAGQSTDQMDVMYWKCELARVEMRIEYLRTGWANYAADDPNFMDKIDWGKISSVNFEDKRTAEECRARWANFFDPSIKKESWTRVEKDKLADLLRVQEGKIDWVAMARQLDMKRTPLDLFKQSRREIFRYASKNKREWTPEEDKRILCGMVCYGQETAWVHRLSRGDRRRVYAEACIWPKIAKLIPGRRAAECRERYNSALSLDAQVSYWTSDDDFQLVKGVHEHGTMHWNLVAKNVLGRTEQQCKHRWAHALKPFPEVTNNWTKKQDDFIVAFLASDIDRGADTATSIPKTKVPKRRLTKMVRKKKRPSRQHSSASKGLLERGRSCEKPLVDDYVSLLKKRVDELSRWIPQKTHRQIWMRFLQLKFLDQLVLELELKSMQPSKLDHKKEIDEINVLEDEFHDIALAAMEPTSIIPQEDLKKLFDD